MFRGRTDLYTNPSDPWVLRYYHPTLRKLTTLYADEDVATMFGEWRQWREEVGSVLPTSLTLEAGMLPPAPHLLGALPTRPSPALSSVPAAEGRGRGQQGRPDPLRDP